ncbi:MAG: 6-phosphogluconolactonase, partial [Gemmatimonadota bacterium]
AAAARLCAERFAAAAREAVEARGGFHAALAGGGTPRLAYALLAEEPLASAVPGGGVQLWWGDERCVPPGHPRSNFRMAREALLSRVPVREAHVHRVRGELGAARAAAAYERELCELREPGGAVPRLDLAHLGMGGDGHTASLFPFSPVLLERHRLAAPALHDGEPRVTLTPSVLDAASRLEFLVTGADKAQRVRTALRGALDPLRIPAQLVRPASGEPVWILDEAAASRLEAPG